MRISIHALREEGDLARYAADADSVQFLSTPSVRRATDVSIEQQVEACHFYPRPP